MPARSPRRDWPPVLLPSSRPSSSRPRSRGCTDTPLAHRAPRFAPLASPCSGDRDGRWWAEQLIERAPFIADLLGLSMSCMSWQLDAAGVLTRTSRTFRTCQHQFSAARRGLPRHARKPELFRAAWRRCRHCSFRAARLAGVERDQDGGPEQLPSRRQADRESVPPHHFSTFPAAVHFLHCRNTINSPEIAGRAMR